VCVCVCVCVWYRTLLQKRFSNFNEVISCINKGYKQTKYDETANEMKSMLTEAGWKADFLNKKGLIIDQVTALGEMKFAQFNSTKPNNTFNNYLAAQEL